MLRGFFHLTGLLAKLSWKEQLILAGALVLPGGALYLAAKLARRFRNG